MNELLAFINVVHVRPVDALLVLALLGIVLTIYRAHRNPNNPLDVFDVVKENGRVSKTAIMLMGAFGVLSWQMMRLTVDGKMTEGYMTIYAATFVAPILAQILKASAPAASTSTTSTTSITVAPAPAAP